MSTQKYYLPELNYWFTNYWTMYGELAIEHLHIPEIESDSSFFPSNSFLELLFNNNFQLDQTGGSYNFMFDEKTLNTLDKSTVRRLKVNSGLVTCYTTDESGLTDIYNLSDSTSDSRIMMDKLLDYRIGNNVDLSGIDYSGLDSNLPKLVYLYLDLAVNGIYNPIESVTPLSTSSSILENMFELYLVNEAHRLVRQWKEFIEADVLELRPIRLKYVVDEDLETEGEIEITENLPHDTDKLSIFRNGTYLEKDNYTLVNDSSSLTIGFDSTSVFQEEDVIVLDYFVTVEV